MNTAHIGVRWTIGKVSDRGWEALSWAAEEVAAGGGRLIVCHGCPATSGLAEAAVSGSRRLIELGHRVVLPIHRASTEAANVPLVASQIQDTIPEIRTEDAANWPK